MMKKETSPIRKNLTFVFAISTLLIFGGSFVLSLRPGVSVSAMRDANTNTPTPVSTSTPTRTPTLISGVLTCNTVTAGVTCVNYGAYLDYNINKVVTGLTGGATASDITIGTYKRTTNGGSMGMSSNFLHCETSTFSNNIVYSAVGLKPFDAGWVGYPGFTSGSGTNVCVTNNVPTDWRYIPGSGGWPNTISVKGNVDWAITGYSIVGHIYLYSNQNFMTVTPTMTPSPTATATATMTSTPTVTPTSAAQCYGDSCNGLNPQTMGCGVDADTSQNFRNVYDESNNLIGKVENRYSPACLAQWERTRNTTNSQLWAEGSIRWGGNDYSPGIWSAEGVATLEESLYTPMYAVSAGFGPALNCGNLSTSPVSPPSYPLDPDYVSDNCFAN